MESPAASACVQRNPRSPVPRLPGTYILILEASCGRRARIGAIGTLEIEPGYYAYVGSARGPGGLAARIDHHRRRARRPRWHIDHLRRGTAFREVWFALGNSSEREHRWADGLAGAPAASIPLPGFGATDCSCRSHLFRFASKPRLAAYRRRLIGASNDSTPGRGATGGSGVV